MANFFIWLTPFGTGFDMTIANISSSVLIDILSIDCYYSNPKTANYAY